MKELNLNQSKAVSGGFWGAVFAIAAGLLADAIRNKRDRELAKREGMDPSRRETTGF